jgi:hypothetical protein
MKFCDKAFSIKKKISKHFLLQLISLYLLFIQKMKEEYTHTHTSLLKNDSKTDYNKGSYRTEVPFRHVGALN